MRRRRGLVTAVLLGLVPVPLAALPASGAVAAPASPASATVSVSCRSPAHPSLARTLDRDIDRVVRGRISAVAIGVDAPGQRVQCWLDGSAHFDSASVVKVTILSALLRKTQQQHRNLTRTEAARATEMITESDNDAASDLWDDVGRYYLQHFLNLAHMTQTYLGPGPYWGLTRITAYNEVLLLRLLRSRNSVLDTSSRDYVLDLMARVIPAQRWGVPAGAPTRLTVHVKNGWLPLYPYGWRINSIGVFTGRGGGYSIVVLTQDNPTMTYGIDTIEAAARVVNRDLNPAAKSRVPSSVPAASRDTPDESVPATAGTP
ncbi:MAG TPA: serine hydrolase [Streptosporangiaceae bacterium]|nr:serine hydrolase [Streptosporangiaceae bacterium]